MASVRVLSPGKFRIGLEEFMDEVNDEVKHMAVGASKEAIEKIVFVSPIWFGPYIQSHRIGINHRDLTHEPRAFESITDFKVNRVPEEVAIGMRKMVKMRMLGELPYIKAFDTIYLTNTLPYAYGVEIGLAPARGEYKVYLRGFNSANSYLRKYKAK